MEQEELTKKWIKFMGKDKLQSLQDALAAAVDMSVCLVDLQGRALTVRSKPLLLCHQVRKSKRELCKKEFLLALEKCKNEMLPCVHECYFGLKYLLYPVLSNGKLVAIVHCGGYYEGRNILPERLAAKFAVPVLQNEQMEKNYQLILQILNIMDFDLDIAAMQSEGEQAVVAPKNDAYAFGFFEGKLSKRECDVAMLVCEGISNKLIEERLYISEKTVKTHISNILNKLEVKDRMQIMMLARK